VRQRVGGLGRAEGTRSGRALIAPHSAISLDASHPMGSEARPMPPVAVRTAVTMERRHERRWRRGWLGQNDVEGVVAEAAVAA
jgi:hypothetical protein